MGVRVDVYRRGREDAEGTVRASKWEPIQHPFAFFAAPDNCPALLCLVYRSTNGRLTCQLWLLPTVTVVWVVTCSVVSSGRGGGIVSVSPGRTMMLPLS